MKFKIGRVEQVGDNLQVDVYFDDLKEQRESFGFPLEYAENDRYVDELKLIFKRRNQCKKVKINNSVVDKEFEV